MINDERDLISNYLHDRLNQSEKEAFEKRLETDIDFATEVKAISLYIFTVNKQQEDFIFDIVEDAFSKNDNTQKKEGKRNKIIYSTIAIILLLSLIGSYLYYSYPSDNDVPPSNKASSLNLFASYDAYKFNHFKAKKRGNSDSLRYVIFQNYSNKNYSYALKEITALEKVYEKSLDSIPKRVLNIVSVYKAICLIEINNPKAANTILIKTHESLDIEEDENLFSEIEYYLAISYWKIGKSKEAIIHLNNLLSSSRAENKQLKNLSSKAKDEIISSLRE